MSAYGKGADVKWEWGDGFGAGRIKERYTEKVTITIKGAEVTRRASQENPAYLIVQENGDEVLKSHNELVEGA